MKKRRFRMNLIVNSYIITPIILILLSLYAITINRKNIMFVLVYMEIILVSLSILFSVSIRAENNIFGQYYAILILTIAAVESAILICLVVEFFRGNGNVEIITLNARKKRRDS